MQQFISFLFLFLLWISYYAVHSLLATDKVKQKLKASHGFIASNYRLLYSLISITALMPVLYFMLTLPKVEVLKGQEFFRPLSYLFVTSGVIFIRRGFKEYSFSSFIGFSQSSEPDTLQRSGILGKVRHPLYTGTILVFVSLFFFSLTYSALIALIATIAYLPVGIYLEEKKLVAHYGQEYLDYKKEVPRLVPKKWF